MWFGKSDILNVTLYDIFVNIFVCFLFVCVSLLLLCVFFVCVFCVFFFCF